MKAIMIPEDAARTLLSVLIKRDPNDCYEVAKYVESLPLVELPEEEAKSE